MRSSSAVILEQRVIRYRERAPFFFKLVFAFRYMMQNDEGRDDGGSNGDMVRRVVMEMVEDATVPGAIWTSGKKKATGEQCLM